MNSRTKDNTTKKVYLYARLSKEDEVQDDSVSIQNQQLILEKYAEENGFKNYEFVFDDGYSGYSFNRPSLMRIIDEAERGLVSAIIVKDLSRFGRNHIFVGYYTEIVFPQKDVRFIAIHDNVDDEKGENDLAPMINLFNEWVIKSTSKKIRAVQQAKGKSGERLAVIPKYGYRKDPNDNKKWIIDEESAAIVRRIFSQYVSGKNAAQIADALNSEHVLNPSGYKFEHGIISKSRSCEDPYHWHTTSIHKILDSQEYIGDTINFKTYSKSYKDSRSRLNPKENQMVFENTHPAVIDVETWEIVCKMRQHKRRTPRHGNIGLFTGIAYCPDCGQKLYFHTRELWNKDKTKSRLDGSYSCSLYRKQTQYQRQNGEGCTAHYIREEILAELVLEELRELLQFARSYENDFAKLVMNNTHTEHDKSLLKKQADVVKYRAKIDELDALFERLYLDNVSGKVTDERYEKMSAKFETEQAELKEKLVILEDEVAELEHRSINVDKFLALVRKYTHIEELTPAIVHEFIDKIIIHEPEQARGNRKQKVEIIYNNIGVAPCLEVGA